MAVVAVEEDLGVLVERAQAADEDAWEALYRRAFPKLLAYASRRLDRDRAREAVAETMARAVAKLPGFTPQGAGFEAWLFGICRYVVLDAQRAAGRTGYAPPTDLTAVGSDPADGLLQREEAARVRAAFVRLADDDRELLELRVVAGLTSEEVASVLGKRPGAVRMAQSRALARLRRLLDEEEGSR